MNIHLQALGRTAKILFTCVAIAFLVTFIFANVSVKNILIAVAVASAVLGVYAIYSICLGQIKYENALKQMVDSK